MVKGVVMLKKIQNTFVILGVLTLLGISIGSSNPDVQVLSFIGCVVCCCLWGLIYYKSMMKEREVNEVRKEIDSLYSIVLHNDSVGYIKDYYRTKLVGLMAKDYLFIDDKEYVGKFSECCCLHAFCGVGGRWFEGEKYIIKDPFGAYFYAREIIKGRWPEAEPVIMGELACSVVYAQHVIGGRWLEAEANIMKDPEWAMVYTQCVTGGEWPDHV